MQDLKNLFRRISSEILFGSYDDNVCEDMCNLLETVFEVVLNPLDLLTAGMLSKFNMNPYTARFKEKRDLIGKRIIALCDRLLKQDVVQSNTFLGGMVNYNKHHPEDPILPREIIGNIFLFVVASQDTTRISSGWALHFLGKDKEGQKLIRQEAIQMGSINEVCGVGDNNITFDKLENSPILTA